MMPIRKGDGTGISAVRLGDGTNISEIRKGDGAVLWSAGADIPDSGVSRWGFENSNNDTSIAVDEWGGNDGTVSGATYLPSGGPDGNGAYSFDGVDDFISVGSPSNLVQKPFSVSVLASFDSLGSFDTLFSHSQSYPTAGWDLRKNPDDTVNFEVADNDTLTSISGSTTVSTNVYYLVTGTYGSYGDVTLYLDDNQEAIDNGPFDAQASGTETGDTRIGYRPSFGAIEMGGEIARVDYYSKELSSAEVANLNNTGRIDG